MSADENTPIDPRIQIELEKLNVATESINKFEIELDEAKGDFRKLLTDSIDRIKQLSTKLEHSIKQARPYYEARLTTKDLAKNTQQAAISYEKARSLNTAAKEMVFLAEQGLEKKTTLDAACQEMLSHATSRVNETQQQCFETERSFKMCELKQEYAANKVIALQAQLKQSIKNSRPYYETRANNITILNKQKQRIMELEGKVSEAKMNYNETLKCLELISEEIHKMRQERVELLENHKKLYFNSPAETHELNRIDYRDEYLDFPVNLSPPDSDSSSEDYHRTQGYSQIQKEHDGGVEKWTEIILTDPSPGDVAAPRGLRNRVNEFKSKSNGSEYNKDYDDDEDDDDDDDEDDEDENDNDCDNGEGRIVKNPDKKYAENLTNWITKSNLKAKERRQSLDILYDASDKVKDVFAQGMQKVGRTLERRNSESEASMEFSLFNNRAENLTDEQVDNLNLGKSISSIYEEFLHLIK